MSQKHREATYKQQQLRSQLCSWLRDANLGTWSLMTFHSCGTRSLTSRAKAANQWCQSRPSDQRLFPRERIYLRHQVRNQGTDEHGNTDKCKVWARRRGLHARIDIQQRRSAQMKVNTPWLPTRGAPKVYTDSAIFGRHLTEVAMSCAANVARAPPSECPVKHAITSQGARCAVDAQR